MSKIISYTFVCVFSFFATITLVAPARAELIAYDQFDGYTDGELNGQGQGFGWAGPWDGSTDAIVLNTGNLTNVLLETYGGGASLGTNTSYGEYAVTRVLETAITNAGTYYFGFLIQQTHPGANHNFLRLKDTSGSVWSCAGSWNSLTTWQLIRKDPAGPGQSAWDSIGTGVNETEDITHMVIKFELGAAGSGVASLYINPANAAALGGSANATYTYSSPWTEIYSVSASRTTLSGKDGVMAFDEIRLGTEAADMFDPIYRPPTGTVLIIR